MDRVLHGEVFDLFTNAHKYAAYRKIQYNGINKHMQCELNIEYRKDCRFHITLQYLYRCMSNSSEKQFISKEITAVDMFPVELCHLCLIFQLLLGNQPPLITSACMIILLMPDGFLTR